MPCDTCGHTLALIGNDEDGCATRHCERCGTLVVERITRRDVYVPKLVERCRQYRANHPVALSWDSLGIAEAIRPPVEHAP